MNKNLKTEIDSGATTSGNVKITLIRDGKEIDNVTIHNTGTVDLCEYILSALIGDYVIARRPDIIVPYYKDTGNKIVPIGNGSPSISTKVVIPASYWETHPTDENGGDGGFCAAVITFLIPSAIISGMDINGFQLLSKDNSRKLYAIAELPEDSTISVSGDTNLKVEWTMYVSYIWNIDRGV